MKLKVMLAIKSVKLELIVHKTNLNVMLVCKIWRAIVNAR